MLKKVIYILQQAIEESDWELVESVLQLIQDIEDGYFDNDTIDIDTNDTW